MKKICFFAKTTKKDLDLVQWYKNDIQILKDLGYKVILSTSFKEIPLNCDLYCSWWYTTSVFPLIKAKILNKPLIILGGGSEVVTSLEIGGYYSKSFFKKMIINLCIKLADCSIAISKNEYYDLKRLGVKKSKIIYHAIDTKIYSPKNGIKKTENIILSISVLTKGNIERKKIWTIIKSIPYVIKKFNNVKFVLIGKHLDGYYELKKFTEKTGIDKYIKFVGEVTAKEKIEYLQKALIYVQPTAHEAFGVAIAEAMSCELPVISSKRGAVSEVLGNCGLYVDPDDPKDLANKIIFLLKDNELQKRLGREARNRVLQKFTYAKRKQKIKEVIDSLI